MTGFEPRTSGIASNPSTNGPKTTALGKIIGCGGRPMTEILLELLLLIEAYNFLSLIKFYLF